MNQSDIKWCVVVPGPYVSFFQFEDDARLWLNTRKKAWMFRLVSTIGVPGEIPGDVNNIEDTEK